MEFASVSKFKIHRLKSVLLKSLRCQSRSWIHEKASSKIQSSYKLSNPENALCRGRGINEWPRRPHQKAHHHPLRRPRLRHRPLQLRRLLRVRFLLRLPQLKLRLRCRRSRCVNRGSAPAMRRIPRENFAPDTSSAGTTIRRKWKPESGRTRKFTAANFAKRFTSLTRSRCRTASRCAINNGQFCGSRHQAGSCLKEVSCSSTNLALGQAPPNPTRRGRMPTRPSNP